MGGCEKVKYAYKASSRQWLRNKNQLLLPHPLVAIVVIAIVADGHHDTEILALVSQAPHVTTFLKCMGHVCYSGDLWKVHMGHSYVSSSVEVGCNKASSHFLLKRFSTQLVSSISSSFWFAIMNCRPVFSPVGICHTEYQITKVTILFIKIYVSFSFVSDRKRTNKDNEQRQC